MASTVTITIKSTISGTPEGGTDSISLTLTNSSAVVSLTRVTATTAIGSAQSISVPSSGKYILVIPPSTNDLPFRMGSSTVSSDGGIVLSSVGASLISVPSTTTTYYFWTTATTAVTPIRVSIF